MTRRSDRPGGTLLRPFSIALVTGIVLPPLVAISPPFAGRDLEDPARWRCPASLWLAPGEERLLVACEKTGTICVIDTRRFQLVEEVPVGKSLVAMTAARGGNTVVVCDAGANQLLVLDRKAGQLQIRFRVPMPRDPVGVSIDPEGRTCWVTSRWSRILTKVDLSNGEVVAAARLDFSPRSCVFLADGRTLVVADAFGGKLALFDTKRECVLRQITIPGHNIRGLALSPDGENLLVSHIILTESAGTTHDNVFWGITMTSNLRVIPVHVLFDSDKNPIREGHTHFFGDPGHAAGDPGAIVTLADGTMVVCLAGVAELAVGRYYPYSFQRIRVGQRPRAIAVTADEKIGYVANAHSDSISMIDLSKQTAMATVSLGKMPRLGLAEEGERLFYDARLSLDGWFSCHSCHTDGHTSGQNADTFSDGSYGTPKNIPSLLATGSTGPWAWNGSKPTLDEQVHSSMRLTMQPESPPRGRDAAAIVAYLRTLAPPSRLPSLRRGGQGGADTNAEQVERGRRSFEELGCAACHAPPLYTSDFTYDVGLEDGTGGNKRFNPPSLRGLVHSAPYLHDGRAQTLEAVFRQSKHMLRRELSCTELDDLVAFLQSL